VAIRPLARRQRWLIRVRRDASSKYVAVARELAPYFRIGSMSPPGRTSMMRWNIKPSGHDPRQIDFLAIVAMILIVIVVGHFFSEPVKRRGTSSFFEPSQTVRW
jgi:hypothetical protein